MCMYVYTYGGHRTILGVNLGKAITSFKAGPSMAWSLPAGLKWLAREPPGFCLLASQGAPGFCLCLPSTQGHVRHFDVCCGDQTCQPNTLLTKQSSSLLFCFSFLRGAYVSQAGCKFRDGLGHLILLPLFPKCWGHSHICAHIQFGVVLETEHRATLCKVSTNCTTSSSSTQNLCEE